MELICLIIRTGLIAGIVAEIQLHTYKHPWNVYMHTIIHLNHVYARVQQYAKLKGYVVRGTQNRKLQFMNIFMIDCIGVSTNNTINTLI